MRFNIKLIQFESWCGYDYKDPVFKKIFWIRFLGYGIHITNSRALFSERNGMIKSYKLPFGYRLKFLGKS